MSKPKPTVSDYMALALTPVLIMALAGSLCFFLIEVFYRGRMMGTLCWVMFWFIIGIVLVSRIAIESSRQHAAVYGLGLAAATWLYMIRTQPAYLVGIVLLAIVWFCVHKLVWDCTLIDEDADSSGQGLLQKTPPPAAPEKSPAKKQAGKGDKPHAPGRWVVYFSMAALPLFGVGQMLLPGDAVTARRAGFISLVIYLGAALGLLVTTSFLGLRRYLRQRYLKMPATIALAWLKFGVGVALIVLIGAVFVPRPGANEAWTALSYQINYQLRRACQYASPANPPGSGAGQPGNDAGGKEGNAQKPAAEEGGKPASDGDKPAATRSQPETGGRLTPPLPQGGSIYDMLRITLSIIAVLVAGRWIWKHRYMLREMFWSMIAAIAKFFRNLLEFAPSRQPAKTEPAGPTRRKSTSFAEYKNPFFSTKEYVRPPSEIILYSYEAFQVWAKEQGTVARPEETAREFCVRAGEQNTELEPQLGELARLYAYAAYGGQLPPNSDLEPIRELWRLLPTIAKPSQPVG
jgi:hypothetical protein